MYDKKHLVDAPLMKPDDPKWVQRQERARTFVRRHAIDDQDLALMLEILGLAA